MDWIKSRDVAINRHRQESTIIKGIGTDKKQLIPTDKKNKIKFQKHPNIIN